MKEVLGKAFFLFIMLFTVVCCDDKIDDPDSLYTFKGMSIMEYIESNRNLSMFAKVLKISRNSGKSNSSSVSALLGSRGHFTTFAPDNTAMTIYLDSIYGKNNYDIDTIPQSVADKIVLNCVLDLGDRPALSEMALPEGILEESTLNDCNFLIRFGRYGDGVFTKVNNAHIVKHDIELSNGFVEIMDRVIEPSPQTVTGLIQQTEGMQIFSRLLDLTSWGDSMLAFKDKKYVQEEVYGSNAYITPSNRMYGYMAFVETDKVFHEKWGIPYPEISEDDGHIINWDVILHTLIQKCKQAYPTATHEDMTHSDNAVNTFVAYHLVDGKYSYDDLVRHSKIFSDWDTKNLDSYYCTKGKQRHLLKVTHVVNDGSTRLNRHSYFNNAFDGDYSETSCDIQGVQVHGDSDIYGYNFARNGYYYTLDDILLYTDEVKEVVLNGRIRYGVIGYLPEISSLIFKPRKFGEREYELPHDYCNNLITNNMYHYEGYMSNRSIEDYWLALGNKVTDFTLKLMPVPFAGKWQVRMSYNMMFDDDAIDKVFVGDRRILKEENAVGLPTRAFEISNVRLLNIFKNDYLLDKDSVACIENDFQLIKHGFMKGPKLYHSIFTGSADFRDAAHHWIDPNLLTMRDHPSLCRRIVYEGYMEPDKEYYLRIQCKVWQQYITNYIPYRYPKLDYIELVPEGVYNNPLRAEDVW